MKAVGSYLNRKMDFLGSLWFLSVYLGECRGGTLKITTTPFQTPNHH